MFPNKDEATLKHFGMQLQCTLVAVKNCQVMKIVVSVQAGKQRLSSAGISETAPVSPSIVSHKPFLCKGEGQEKRRCSFQAETQ